MSDDCVFLTGFEHNDPTNMPGWSAISIGSTWAITTPAGRTGGRCMEVSGGGTGGGSGAYVEKSSPRASDSSGQFCKVSPARALFRKYHRLTNFPAASASTGEAVDILRIQSDTSARFRIGIQRSAGLTQTVRYTLGGVTVYDTGIIQPTPGSPSPWVRIEGYMIPNRHVLLLRISSENSNTILGELAAENALFTSCNRIKAGVIPALSATQHATHTHQFDDIADVQDPTSWVGDGIVLGMHYPIAGTPACAEFNNEVGVAYSPTVTLTANIAGGDTSFVYTSTGDPIKAGDIVRIGSEDIYVSAVNTGTNTCSGLGRAWNGTAVAAHTAGDAITLIAPPSLYSNVDDAWPTPNQTDTNSTVVGFGSAPPSGNLRDAFPHTQYTPSGSEQVKRWGLHVYARGMANSNFSHFVGMYDGAAWKEASAEWLTDDVNWHFELVSGKVEQGGFADFNAAYNAWYAGYRRNVADAGNTVGILVSGIALEYEHDNGLTPAPFITSLAHEPLARRAMAGVIGR